MLMRPQSAPDPRQATVNGFLFRALTEHRDLPMQILRDQVWTYADAARAIHGVAQHLQQRGVGPDDRVALIAENHPRWAHVYGGILAAGGVVVPRGEDVSEAELHYILEHSGCKLAFAGSARTAQRIQGRLPVIPMQDETFPGPQEVGDDVLEEYAGARGPQDMVVILYTSGTTGRPKGVVLEQRNIAHNLRVLPPLVDTTPGDVWVSILPPWHTFEQTAELCAFTTGCTMVYSSKRRIREDLRRYRPHYFASVPRIWETIKNAALTSVESRGRVTRTLFRLTMAGSRLRLRGSRMAWPLDWAGRELFYRKIVEATGGRLKCAVSGGGALPPHVDEFFAATGIKLLVGYGLTETAPVVAIRRPDDNVLGTIGRALEETEIRIGEDGTIYVRGPQVMRGYYKEPELTRSVLSEDGWFDTGDLGSMTPEGDLIFVGRKKDTIVLSGGENVEPEPIESRILECPFIEQVVLVGQDRKTLAALVVPSQDVAGDPALEARIREELRRRTGPAGGFRPCETVTHFMVVKEPFSPENGLLTGTLKVRRGPITQRYRQEIEGLYEV